MKYVLLFVGITLSTAGIAQNSAPTLPPPPPDRDLFEIDGCSFSKSEIRGEHPALSAFLREMASEARADMFENPRDAIRFYIETRRAELQEERALIAEGIPSREDLSEDESLTPEERLARREARKSAREARRAARASIKQDRAEFREERRALRQEIKAFNSAYPKSSDCRQAAWWALGANVASEGFIDKTAGALESEETEG